MHLGQEEIGIGVDGLVVHRVVQGQSVLCQRLGRFKVRPQPVPFRLDQQQSCLGANAHRGGQYQFLVGQQRLGYQHRLPTLHGIVLAQIPGPLQLMQQRLDRGVGPGQTLDIGNARKQVHEWTTASGWESRHHNAPVQPLVFPLGRGPAVSRYSNRAR